jgi:hypothetical protein
MKNKTIKKMLIAGFAAVTGLSMMGTGVAEAACMNDKAFCYDATIYGGLTQTTPDGGDSQLQTFGRSDVKIKAKVAETDGWNASGTIKLELNTSKGSSLNKADEVYLTIEGESLSIIAGLTDIGGVDKGNAYTPEAGLSAWNGATGYGDEAGDAESLAISFPFGLTAGIIADYNETTMKQSQVIDVVYELTAVENLSLGIEVESGSSSTNGTSGKATTATGLGFSYNTGMVAPFLNYGSYNDGSNTATDINIGVDLHDIAGLGITIGTESTNTGVTGAEAVSYNYVDVNVPIGPGAFNLGLFSTKAGTQVSFQFSLGI